MTPASTRPEWLGEGEEILWTGRPLVALALLKPLAMMAVAVGGLYFIVRYQYPDRSLADLVEGQTVQAAVAVLFFLALPAIVAAQAARIRYFVTDLRLVSASPGGRLRWALAPEFVMQVERGGALGADVRFTRYVRSSSSGSRGGWTGFRHMARAGEVADRVREWLLGHDEALREAAGRRRAVTSGAGSFSLELPEEWDVRFHRVDDPADAARVRPTGAEDEPSGGPEAEADWNVVTAMGSRGTAVAVEGYPGERTEEEPDPAAAALASLLAPATLEEEEVTLGGVEGERVRREMRGVKRVGGRRHEILRPVDEWILRGEGSWYRITATASPSLPSSGEVLRQIVETFRAEG